MIKIPFYKTSLGEEEKKAISDVIDNGWVVLGPKTKEFEDMFADYVGASYAVFVDSGTSALLMGLQAMKNLILPKWNRGMGISDDTSHVFKVPSLTFTATAEALINSGFQISFSDVHPKTFCLEDVDLYSLPVNLLGNRAKKGAMIYDSAHRIEKDDMKNTVFVDEIWCYSLYATKNITTVQGGMICTQSEEIYKWLIKARDHGLDLGTKERYQGKYKQYDVEFVGWRTKGDDLRAVIGIEQLKKLPELTKKRNYIVECYNRSFDLDRIGNHVYPVIVENREQFMQFMADKGIQCTVHFRPLHLMTGYKSYYHNEPLPVTEFLGQHIVSLPLFPQMTYEEINYVSNAVLESNQLVKK